VVGGSEEGFFGGIVGSGKFGGLGLYIMVINHESELL